MNPLNCCTLPAAKRLHEAGLLKRDPEIGDRVSVDCEDDRHEGFVINQEAFGVEVRFDDCEETSWMDSYAVTILYAFAEVWRELPESIIDSGTAYFLKLMTVLGTTVAGYFSNGCSIKDFKSPNPTDALIALLIWPRGRKEAV